MLYFELRDDDTRFQEILNEIISGLLPHENYDASYFSDILSGIFKYIKLEEFSMEYYVLLYFLNEMNKIKIIINKLIPIYTKESLKMNLDSSIEQIIKNPYVRLEEYCKRLAIGSNFDIPTNRTSAYNLIYQKVIQLYDDCFNLKRDSSQVLTKISMLKDILIEQVSTQSIESQFQILKNHLKVGKTTYSGALGWLRYMQIVSKELQERIDNVENTELFVVDSISQIKLLKDEIKNSGQKIADWGIEPIDYDNGTIGTPILENRLVVVVALPNIGKTMLSINSAVNVLRTGGTVLFMFGEGMKSKVYNQIVSNYIYQEYHKFVPVKFLNDLDNQPEEIQKLYNLASLEIAEKSSLLLVPAMNYDTVEEELTQIYEKHKFDFVVIDHSLTLIGGNGLSNQEKVDKLALACRNFKRKYPVCILVTSHPSSTAKDFLSKDKCLLGVQQTTAESGKLENEADEVFILRSNDNLRREKCIAIEVHKRRDCPVPLEYIKLNTCFEVCALEYNTEEQIENDSGLNAEEALETLDKIYNSDDEKYIL